MKSRLLFAAFAMVVVLPAGARPAPDVEVKIPAQSLERTRDRTANCSRCCLFEDRNYSEGAVIKSEGILLQCQREQGAVGTNPLVWRRVKP
ncbi:YnjH family protein [Enterobacteriaceae bacterium BIT-l23]|uniref:YnjH family protein n=1 Tax=Jejubacter sp. L23 TaxID=3092086 RepID=UPI001585651B|nr:YnjH family protein [Enterobacteriaceae bacterium BIT-l23]